MPFYLRKSIKAGPFRLNLSKSGIGVSAGIPGLRFGTGPRGNYVHMGSGGLYYRHSPNPAGKPAKQPRNRPETSPSVPSGRSDDIVMQEIESGSVLEMKDASAAELLRDFDEKQKMKRLWPAVLLASVGLFGTATYLALPDGVLVAAVFIGGPLTLIAAWRDRARKTVAILYDMEPDAQEKYEAVHDVFDALNKAKRKWHIESSGDVMDKKYQAGADQVIERKRVQFSSEPPATVKTNIPVPSIPVGRQTLCFFPDRLLVFDKDGVGAVSYSDLRWRVGSTQFIETERPPRDAEKVGQTWRYVNKGGGPDRRFNNNPEIPIMLYDEIRLQSDSGLNECLNVSLVGPAIDFATAVSELAGE